MKKLIFILSLFFTSILITNAAPCKVISGDGTNIGDEIQCGTENFYVLSNDGESIKMLAKYNLYVGRTYYKVEFDQSFETYADSLEYYEENYASGYDGYRRFIVNESNEYYGVLAYKYIDYEDVKQEEIAIGAHGDLKVEPLFPEVAVYSNDTALSDNFYDENRYSEPYYDGYKDYEINSNSELYNWLKEYVDYLEGQGITSLDCTILSVKNINDIVSQTSGKELPLEEWYNNKDNWGKVNSNYYEAVVVGSIKDLMPEGYEWLWSTTYWTKTLDYNTDWDDLYFVDTMGDLCNSSYCSISVGAGIRPVITIPTYLIYQIETKTDGNGTVEADHVEAEGGTVIKFTVTPKEGYVLSVVKVTDANGNVVTFTDYTFTMPNANVLIEATFVPIKTENPNTLSKNICLLVTVCLSVITLGSIVHRKIKWIKE